MSETFRGSVQNNRLLKTLQIASRNRINPYLEEIDLQVGAVIWVGGAAPGYAYFPQNAVLSHITVVGNGSTVETARIGRADAFGLLAAIYGHVSFSRCVVDIDGSLVRCPIQALQSEFNRCKPVRNLLIKYSQTLLSQVQHTVA